MKKHIAACRSNPQNRNEKKQKTLELCRGGADNGQLKVRHYTSMGYRTQLIEFIVMDEQPFRTVEGVGFQRLMRYMNPAWDPVSRITCAKDILKRFNEEKVRLKVRLVGHRVSVTSDTWTSIQNLNYMVVTAHWIDEFWEIQKRIIGFFLIGDHKGETIAQEVLKCLTDWGIKLVQSITLDNASANDVAAEKAKLKLLQKQGEEKSLYLGGEMFHMRCICHIVNLIVGDGLQFLGPCIESIRKGVKYVRSSPARYKRFNEMVVQEEIHSKAQLCLDVPTRWNSTYLMLKSAIKYRKAFDRMNEDLNYVNFFDGAERPNDIAWENAETFITFLKTFFDLTVRLSGTAYATANLCFRDICAVKKELNVLRGKPVGTMLEKMGRSMDAKFGKYWGDPTKVNLVVFFATLLDPRYKLLYIEHCLNAVFGAEVKSQMVPKITQKLYELFAEYDDHVPDQASSSQPNIQLMSDDLCEQMTSVDELDTSFMQSVIENQGTKKHEIERYLQDTQTGLNLKSQAFDVLNWWKANSANYKVLAKIAKDILVAPVSTGASESAFSGGGRILDPFRSSLAPATVEALILLRNWLHENNDVYVQGTHLDENEMNSYEDSIDVENSEHEQDRLRVSSLTGGSSNMEKKKKNKEKEMGKGKAKKYK